MALVLYSSTFLDTYLFRLEESMPQSPKTPFKTADWLDSENREFEERLMHSLRFVFSGGDSSRHFCGESILPGCLTSAASDTLKVSGNRADQSGSPAVWRGVV